jgi:hypothetical protein
MSSEPGPAHEVFALLQGLAHGDIERSVPIVRIELGDGTTLDVFRAEQVRERPIAWRVRGFAGNEAPREFVALVLGTIDGRATVMTAAGEPGGGQTVASANNATRKLGELAELIARRVRERFGDA